MRHRREFLGFAAGLAAAGPLLFLAHPRNFRVVRGGVLYRSGQLTPPALDRVLRDYRIKTVVTLRTVRDPARPFPDEWEHRVCAARGLGHARILPRGYTPDEGGEVPADRAVRQFLAVVGDPANHPVLVHCFAGIHRTGTMCAVFRMEYDGWPAARAVAEMGRCGFVPGPDRAPIEDYLRARRWRTRPAAPPAARCGTTRAQGAKEVPTRGNLRDVPARLPAGPALRRGRLPVVCERATRAGDHASTRTAGSATG